MRSVQEGARTRLAGPGHVVSALRTALVGRSIVRFDAPNLDGPAPGVGRVIEHVDCQRRVVDLVWDDGFVLHSRLRWGGEWHVYREGEPWRRPSERMIVGLTVAGWVAACFSPAEVETFRELDVERHPAFGGCAPDVTSAGADLDLCLARLLHHPNPAAPVGEALLDPHVATGIGNVFRSEALYRCGVHPWAPVGELSEPECARLVSSATEAVRATIGAAAATVPTDTRESLLVYGRNGQRCGRCGDTVRVDRGARQRLVYWCAGCQTAHDPEARRPRVREVAMDPHPAAEQFVADLPWRRAAG